MGQITREKLEEMELIAQDDREMLEDIAEKLQEQLRRMADQIERIQEAELLDREKISSFLDTRMEELTEKVNQLKEWSGYVREDSDIIAKAKEALN